MNPNLISAIACLAMLSVLNPTHATEPLPLLHPLFADHAVLQRDAKVPVWGWTAPGEKMSIRFGDQSKEATADKHGRWQATLDPMPPSNEGRVLEVRSPSSGMMVRAVDVLVGDVWLCSGQSNMEMGIGACDEDAEIAKADFPHIRLLTVPRRIAFSPQTSVDTTWLPCSPANITKGLWEGFSAVGYFFGKEMHRELKIPIGLIHASWGGSPCEAWTSGEALAPLGFYPNQLAQVAQVASLPGANQLDDFMDRWYLEKDPGTSGGWFKPDTDVSSWKSATMPAAWSECGLPGYEGIVWLQRSFDLPPSWQDKDLVLTLGAIADVDTTWINGTIVGRCDSYEMERSYTVSATALRPGRNVLTMRVMNKGGGGFSAKPDAFHIRPKDGNESLLSLAGAWRIQASATRTQTGAPLAGNPGTPSVLYNGMIAPLVPYATKGAIWYQGEANTDNPERYHKLLPTLIRDWRSRYGSEDFFFHIVSLANYHPSDIAENPHGWPALREAQSMTAHQVPNCTLAVTIDIGDSKDIHPKNKREVGRRLALNALARTHGREIECSGPRFRAMEQVQNGIRLHFDHADGGLVTTTPHPTGFAIAGEDRKFVPADAAIDGETVIVSSPSVSKPVAVRYGWAADPACNLVNKAKLPAVPFRTDDWPLWETSTRPN